MSADKVDSYIKKAQPFAQPILKHFRALVHKALPEAEEAIKWGVPYFVVNGKNAAGMASFKKHASIMLCSDRRDDFMGKITSDALEHLMLFCDEIKHFQRGIWPTG